MKKNMGTIDRIMRALLAVVVGTLIITGQLSGALAIVLGALAAIFLVTSVISFCPLYTLFGISTCPVESR